MHIIEKKLGILEKGNDPSAALMGSLSEAELKQFLVANLEKIRLGMENQNQTQLSYKHRIKNFTFTCQGHSQDVQIKIYVSEQQVDAPRPLFYFVHGGGWIGGSSAANDNLMRLIADRTGATVASVEYHLAPESKYPGPLEDCYRGLLALLDSKTIEPVDRNRIFVAGESAGGNLAAALTIRLMDQETVNICGQILIYPATNIHNLDRGSYLEEGAEYSSMKKFIGVARDLYLNDPQERELPYVSPLLATVTKPMPKTLLLVAERDGLRSDGLDYAAQLANVGTKVKCILYKGAFHAFINELGQSESADDAAQEIIEFIRAH